MTKKQEARAEFTRLADEFLLTGDGWTLHFNGRLTSRLGRCQFGPKRIEIAEWVVTNLDLDQLLDTVRHEVAHAIAGHAAGHGPLWRRACRLTGANPNRTVKVNAVLVPSRQEGYKWKAHCPQCGPIDSGWYRKPSNAKLHKVCRSRVTIVAA